MNHPSPAVRISRQTHPMTSSAPRASRLRNFPPGTRRMVSSCDQHTPQGYVRFGAFECGLVHTASRNRSLGGLAREGLSWQSKKERNMDDVVDPTLLDLDRYAIGQPVPRSEDPVLVSGKGSFTDDINLAGQAYAVIVRSHHAHGLIR